MNFFFIARACVLLLIAQALFGETDADAPFGQWPRKWGSGAGRIAPAGTPTPRNLTLTWQRKFNIYDVVLSPNGSVSFVLHKPAFQAFQVVAINNGDRDNSTLWEFNLPRGEFNCDFFGFDYASLSVDVEQDLLWLAQDTQVYALGLSDGKVIKHFNQTSIQEYTGYCYGDVVRIGNVVIVGTGSKGGWNMYAFDMDDPLNPLWIEMGLNEKLGDPTFSVHWKLGLVLKVASNTPEKPTLVGFHPRKGRVWETKSIGDQNSYRSTRPASIRFEDNSIWVPSPNGFLELLLSSDGLELESEIRHCITSAAFWTLQPDRKVLAILGAYNNLEYLQQVNDSSVPSEQCMRFGSFDPHKFGGTIYGASMYPDGVSVWAEDNYSKKNSRLLLLSGDANHIIAASEFYNNDGSWSPRTRFLIDAKGGVIFNNGKTIYYFRAS